MSIFLLLQSIIKEPSEVSSKVGAKVVQLEAEIADLRDKNEKLLMSNQKLKSELAEQRSKVDLKDDQLRKIERMTAETVEKLLKMRFDDIMESVRSVHQISMQGYLPTPVEETTENMLSVAASKPVSTPSRIKTATKRERRTPGSETSQQKNVTRWNRQTIPATKPTSLHKRK